MESRRFRIGLRTNAPPGRTRLAGVAKHWDRSSSAVLHSGTPYWSAASAVGRSPVRPADRFRYGRQRSGSGAFVRSPMRKRRALIHPKSKRKKSFTALPVGVNMAHMLGELNGPTLCLGDPLGHCDPKGVTDNSQGFQPLDSFGIVPTHFRDAYTQIGAICICCEMGMRDGRQWKRIMANIID